MSNSPSPNRTPTKSQSLVRPFAAAWRARSYFLIAFVFWALSTTLPIPFSEVAAADKAWWQDLIAKAVVSFDKISYAVFIAGLLYALLSDAFEYIWTNSLQSEVRLGFSQTGEILSRSLETFKSGLVGMTFESVKVWVEGGRGSPDQVRLIGLSSLKSYFGPHQSARDNLVDFITDEILEHSARSDTQTWDTFITNIVIRPCNIPGHFEWEERKNYNIVCSKADCEIPLRLEGSTKVDSNKVLSALDSMEYSIRVGDETKVDFRSWWPAHRDKAVGEKFKIEDNGNIVEYDGVWLRYEFAGTCKLSQERTSVVIFEKSYISEQDRCYSIAVRHATRSLQASLSIEGIANWVVKPPVVSAKLYQRGERVVQIESHHSRACSARVPGWTLPGLALVVEWTPS